MKSLFSPWEGYFLPIAILFFVPEINAFSQESSYCKQAAELVRTIEAFHYSPRKVDSLFTRQVMSNFLDQTDPEGYFFTQDQIKKLRESTHQIENLINHADCDILKLCMDTYQKQYVVVDSLLDLCYAQQLDYFQKDTLHLYGKLFPVNTKHLQYKWEQRIKYQVLKAYFSLSDSLAVTPSLPASDLASLQHDIIRREQCRLHSLQDTSGMVIDFVATSLLNAIASSFDPHTQYFTPQIAKAFDESLATQKKSFGLSIYSNDQNEIEVARIVPASPAWKSNRINVGDVLVEVRIGQTTLEADCSNWYELNELLSADNSQEAEFTIRKADRKEIRVRLIKEALDIDENSVNGFILEGASRLGYLYLPAFYSQADGYSNFPQGCAHDIALELLRLKQEGIQGLILDLRNNGGGLMMEAALMAGIFLDYGAMSIFHFRDEAPQTLKDFNRGTVYSDPMLVLVNANSASASELFAASMQDQNRALIVGSTTYGKATMQQVLPVGARPNQTTHERSNPEGFVKVTQGGFYRVTGESHQKSGVIPDIVLPGLSDDAIQREADLPAAMHLEPIGKKTYYYPRPALPIETLKQQSASRLKSDSIWVLLRNDSAFTQSDKHKIPIDYAGFLKHYSTHEESVTKSWGDQFTVSNPAYIEGTSSVEDSELEINTQIMQQIRSDVYIGEAFNILTDYMELLKK